MEDVTVPVEIWTDGACSPNPGKGGWGAVLKYKGHARELSGYDPDTTNNRMELMGVIEALEALKYPCKVVIHTDSRYVQQGISQWIANWVRNGWVTAAGKPVKNCDLWIRLQEVCNTHEIEWKWVKGHAGNPDNEWADRLAVEARENGA